MAELPAWIQEAKDRAEAASKGPWHVVHCEDRDFATMLRVSTVPDSEEPGDTVAVVVLQMPLEACVSDERWDENGEFIAAARTDVPRLIELVEEMAETLDEMAPSYALEKGCFFPEDCTTCAELNRHNCPGYMAERVRRKYRGEVDKS